MKLKKGEAISRELIQAIEGSRVLIVVFSGNYASSTWCLQELEKIADCIEVPGQRVLPVFYDVNPSEVRKQSGNYEKAFAEYEKRFKEDLQMVQRWRVALTKVANLSGWDVCNKPQYGEIEKIVEVVTSTLGHKFSCLPNDLVGMQSRVEQLEELLNLDSDDDVRVVGICGMGGIGKTTLATALYDRIPHKFGAYCFIDDVSKICDGYSPVGAQRQLLGRILDDENLQTYCLSKTSNLMRTKLRYLKAFIVLDNVVQIEQLKKLAVDGEWLGAGSRILIISRDEHILRGRVDDVYKVQLLNRDEALQLFCKEAFKCDNVLIGYGELAWRALEYAKGHPLAIKVLGSFLFGRDVSEWRSALARLRKSPNRDIMDVLRVSFDGLEEMEKEIFLDIACFFDNKSEWYVKEVLDDCGFYPDIGIRVLVDKSLITNEEGIIQMHDVYKVQLLNRDEALQLFCKEAFKCDNVLIGYVELACRALEYAKGHPLAIKILGSFLFGRDVSEWRSALARLRESPNKDIMDVLRISFDGLEEMEKEIFLDIACFFDKKWDQYVKRVLDDCGFYPDIGIRVLTDKSLIINEKGMIQMHDLLKELGKSIVRERAPKEPGKWSRLWLYEDVHNVMLKNTATKHSEAIVLHPKDIQEKTTLNAEALSKMSRLRLLILRDVNFSGSLNILSNEIRYLSWGKYPFKRLPSSFQPDKLVELILPYSNIEQLWEGIKPLRNLRIMDLRHSKNLIKIVGFRGFPNLQRLNLEGCIKLVHIDSSIELLQKLAFLNLKKCKSLMSLPTSIFGLSSLIVLELSGCSKLFSDQLSKKVRHAKHLKKLDIRETAIHYESTSSVCKVVSRRHKESVGLLFPYLPSFPRLHNLDLSFCNLHQIPDVIGQLHCLGILNLGGNHFVRLPPSIKELSKLRILNLEHCKQLKSFPELPSNIVLPIRYYFHNGLYIFNCPKLAEIEGCINMAFSWMIKMLQVHQDHHILCGHVDIVIPGSQIPGWFNHQGVGRPLSLKPLPTMHDNNWIGIALCAAFVAHDDPTNLGKHMRDYTVYEYDDPNTYVRNRESIWCTFQTTSRCVFSISIPILIKKDVVTVESEHLWVIYFTREQFINFLSRLTEGRRDGDDINFVVKTNHPKGLRTEVKNCGFCWVFKQDLEELKRTMTCSGSSSIQIHDHLGIGGSMLSLDAGNTSY